MLIAVERLLLKLRQPASRADELIALRARLRAEIAADVTDAERAAAARVATLKANVAAITGAVSSCASCAVGQPLPTGRHAGGACCSGITAHIFDDAELSALAHAGTRPRDLVAPRGDHAGCAFRDATSCTLALAHRPARCVHYVCNDLRRELHTAGRLDAIEVALAALDAAMAELRTLRQTRADRDALAPLVDALERTMRR